VPGEGAPATAASSFGSLVRHASCQNGSGAGVCKRQPALNGVSISPTSASHADGQCMMAGVLHWIGACLLADQARSKPQAARISQRRAFGPNRS
jgi:hypothetical protein